MAEQPGAQSGKCPEIEVDSSLAVGILAEVLLFGCGAQDENARVLIEIDKILISGHNSVVESEFWPFVLEANARRRNATRTIRAE